MKLNEAVLADALVLAERDELPAAVRERQFSKRPVPGGTITIEFTIWAQHAPALRSAVEEISNRIGQRLEGSYEYATQDAFTDAAVALGALRRAVNAKIPTGSPYWRTR